ncbi:hypothetical protein DSO57_1034479 [Entomophthora muscae]|uniref:Uncharacterized protein n=1 Tax=Entomophthora muscae TaxID=34485 RepID=A0ACC2RQP8_9FUNG|nr:hypothetical protein DSO57_1034479 [Entomophthora muscae]
MSNYLWGRGFQFHRSSGKKHEYWVKEGQSNEDPLVVMTGFGVGIVGYYMFVKELINHFPNRTIILFETSYVNLKPAASVITETDSLCEVDDMFLDLKLDKCTLMAHSFGTFIAGWIAKHRPHYISKLVLVDPVCFRTWDASFYQTMFRQPPDSLESKAYQILLASGPIVSLGLARHMNWFGSILFPEQITVPTQIFLAENDFLLDPAGLHSYLQHRIAKDTLSHIEITTMDTCRGFFQLIPKWNGNIIGAL